MRGCGGVRLLRGMFLMMGREEGGKGRRGCECLGEEGECRILLFWVGASGIFEIPKYTTHTIWALFGDMHLLLLGQVTYKILVLLNCSTQKMVEVEANSLCIKSQCHKHVFPNSIPCWYNSIIPSHSQYPTPPNPSSPNLFQHTWTTPEVHNQTQRTSKSKR